MSNHAIRQHFNQLASQWDSLPGAEDTAARVERFVRAAAAPSDRLVLDVGCGTGILLNSLLDSDRRVVELDSAEQMLRENRRKWTDPRLRWVCGEALSLPLAAARFDAVLCFGVLPHLGAPEAALGHLLAHLRPGGALAIGHLMDSETLNAFHASLEGPVNRDHLVPARDLAVIIERLGARVLAAEEAPGWYFVRAERRR
jgi:2-polyprenyl-3-methyl-5-hydroxy-6-metoxy-1,4-benzoquinol methylase